MKSLMIYIGKLKNAIFKKSSKKEEQVRLIETNIEELTFDELPTEEYVELFYEEEPMIEEKKEYTLTRETLKKIYFHTTWANVDKYLPFLNKFMNEYEINNQIRIQMFLAQIGHESGELRYVEELASGQAYEGRKDLGNLHPGDGVMFKGRGLIQLTGRNNYSIMSKSFNVDFISNPNLLSEPEWAVRSACWFWSTKGLNSIADTGDFRRVTRIINGGYNGMTDRERIYELCKQHIQYA